MLSCKGGAKLSRPVYLSPHPPGYQKRFLFANSNNLKLSECKDVCIINIFKSNSTVFSDALFCMLSCKGEGQAVQATLSNPYPPGYQR